MFKPIPIVDLERTPDLKLEIEAEPDRPDEESSAGDA